MQKYVQDYWPIFVSLMAIIVSLSAQWAVFGVRISAVEDRQDRQGTAIATLQDSFTTQQSNYAALAAKLDAVNENVVYIRSRIDNAVK